MGRLFVAARMKMMTGPCVSENPQHIKHTLFNLQILSSLLSWGTKWNYYFSPYFTLHSHTHNHLFIYDINYDYCTFLYTLPQLRISHIYHTHFVPVIYNVQLICRDFSL